MEKDAKENPIFKLKNIRLPPFFSHQWKKTNLLCLGWHNNDLFNNKTVVVKCYFHANLECHLKIEYEGKSTEIGKVVTPVWENHQLETGIFTNHCVNKVLFFHCSVVIFSWDQMHGQIVRSVICIKKITLITRSQITKSHHR